MSDGLYVVLAIIAAVLLAGAVAVIAYTGTKSAEREQEQVLTCLNNGGTWIDDEDLCVFPKEAR